MFRCNADEIIGKSIDNLLGPDTVGPHIAADKKLIKSGKQVIYESLYTDDKNVSSIIRITKSPFCDNSGALKGIIGLISEVAPAEVPTANEQVIDNALLQRSIELEERNNLLIGKIAAQLRIENEMVQFENRLEIALKAMNAGAWEFDITTSTLLWSDKCYEIFDLEKGPVQMQLWLSKVFKDDLDRVKEMWSAITTNPGWFDLEFRILLQGQIRWVRKSGYYLAGDDESPEKISGVMVDISEEKEFSETLSNSQRFFKAIIEDQSELICRIRPDGTITFINEAFARFFGVSANSFPNHNLNEVIPDKDYNKIIKSLKSISTSKQIINFEQRLFHDNSRNKVVQWTLRVIYGVNLIAEEYQLVGRDVSEIEESREALRKSEEMFRLIAENSNDIISIHNENGSIEYVSPSVKFILGYTPEELLKSNGEAIVCTEDLEGLMLCRQKMESGEEAELLTFRLRDSQGKLIWFESMIQLQYNNKGEATGRVIAVSRNIQSRKLVEEQQKLTELQLKESNITKDKFFSIIAHDLRSPFTSILGFARLLNDEYDDFSDVERKMMVGQIQNSTESTFQLLDNLLAWAKTQMGRTIFTPVTFTLEGLINESVNQTTPQAEIKNITIQVGKIAPVSVFADLNMIRTVLRNLLSNAVKFSFPGGIIVLNTRIENENLTISVQDHGTGIDSEALQKLLNPNEEIKSVKGTANEKGTGLGLILCREFMERNRGTIGVVSEIGKGSTFSIVLPMNQTKL